MYQWALLLQHKRVQTHETVHLMTPCDQSGIEQASRDRQKQGTGCNGAGAQSLAEACPCTLPRLGLS